MQASNLPGGAQSNHNDGPIYVYFHAHARASRFLPMDHIEPFHDLSITLLLVGHVPDEHALSLLYWPEEHQHLINVKGVGLLSIMNDSMDHLYEIEEGSSIFLTARDMTYYGINSQGELRPVWLLSELYDVTFILAAFPHGLTPTPAGTSAQQSP